MNIAIDSRAAVWYRGTGMGTYTYQLIRHLYAIDKANSYRFVLPDSCLQSLGRRQEGMFQSIAATKTFFWEAVAEAPVEPAQFGAPLDVYHIPHNGIGLPRLGLPKNCRLVVTVHDLIPYAMPETVGKGYLELFLREMPKILVAADTIITVSRYSKQDLIRFCQVPEDKIEVIYEAPEPIYRPMNKGAAKGRLKERYGLEKPFVLYLGGFGPRKNLYGLLSGFAALKKNYGKPLELVLLGRDSPHLQQIRQWAATLKILEDLRFCGFAGVEELPFFYNACVCFVYPSVYEGFGLPPLEAMACGAPVIVANATSLPEVVGGGALTVPPHDAHAIGQAMYQLLSDQAACRELRQKGRQRAALFSWQRTAEETKQVYEKFFSACIT